MDSKRPAYWPPTFVDNRSDIQQAADLQRIKAEEARAAQARADAARAEEARLEAAYLKMDMFSRAAQAALSAADFELGPDHHPSANSLTEIRKIGLHNPQVSAHRKFGPREITFLVASDTQHVVLALRGTETHTNWNTNGLPLSSPKGEVLENIDWSQVDLACVRNAMPVAVPSFPNQLVHHGWQDAVNTIWDQVNADLKEHRAQEKTITVTGHSLGGALAGYLAHRLLRESSFFDPQKEHLLATFGAPHYALRNAQAGKAATLSATFLSLYDKLNNAVVACRRVMADPMSGALVECGLALNALSGFSLPGSVPFQADLRGSLDQLIKEKAPRMKLFAVESEGPAGVDLVTASWDSRKFFSQLQVRLKKPIQELMQLVGTFPVSMVPGSSVVMVLLASSGPLMEWVARLGEDTWGSIDLVGERIVVPTVKTDLWGLHDKQGTYLQGLKGMSPPRVVLP